MPRTNVLFLTFWSGGFVIGGLIFTVVGIALAREAAESASWPSTEGVITNKSIQRRQTRDSDGNRKVRYKPKIEYVFSYNGTQYHGERLSIGSQSYKSRANASSAVAHLKVQSPCTVYYNPRSPLSNTLEVGLKTRHLIFVGIGLLCLSIGAVGGWIMHAKDKKDSAFSEKIHNKAEQLTTSSVKLTQPRGSLKPASRERTELIKTNINRWGRDHIGSGIGVAISWSILNIFDDGHLSYVEVEPHPKEVGYDKFIFLIAFKRSGPNLIATYCMEKGEFVLFSSSPDHGEAIPDKL